MEGDASIGQPTLFFARLLAAAAAAWPAFANQP
jgi:hypothetical protein